MPMILVLSLTDTNMMLAIPNPPTSREKIPINQPAILRVPKYFLQLIVDHADLVQGKIIFGSRFQPAYGSQVHSDLILSVPQSPLRARL